MANDNETTKTRVHVELAFNHPQDPSIRMRVNLFGDSLRELSSEADSIVEWVQSGLVAKSTPPATATQPVLKVQPQPDKPIVMPPAEPQKLQAQKVASTAALTPKPPPSPTPKPLTKAQDNHKPLCPSCGSDNTELIKWEKDGEKKAAYKCQDCKSWLR